jgi:hypothetical protein
MHDWNFINYGTATEEDIFAAAKTLGLDMAAFESDYNSEETQAALSGDKAEGLAALRTNAGAPCSGMGTPSVFVGGIKITPRTHLTEVLNCILTAIPRGGDIENK